MLTLLTFFELVSPWTSGHMSLPHLRPTKHLPKSGHEINHMSHVVAGKSGYDWSDVYYMYPTPKFNIDTKNRHILKGDTLKNHHVWYLGIQTDFDIVFKGTSPAAPRCVGVKQRVYYCKKNNFDLQKIPNRTHWTDPWTWVSNSSSNLLRGPLVRSHSIFDGLTPSNSN